MPYTPLGLLVLAGCSLLDQPRLFMLSLKDDEAMVGVGIDAKNRSGEVEVQPWSQPALVCL